MKLDNQFMQDAIKRVDELQNEIIEKSKLIEGSEEFVKQRLELYKKDEELRAMARDISIQEKQITDSFFSK